MKLVKTKTLIHRKNFLKAAGVFLTLPWLESVQKLKAAETGEKSPMRTMIIMNNMGFYPKTLWPSKAGNYSVTPSLKPLVGMKNNFTLFNGLSHPGTDGGHLSEECFCNAAIHPGTAHFKPSISLDQFTARSIGHKTRFSSLNLSTGSKSLSFTQNGVKLPPISKASLLFKKLFIQGTKSEMEQQLSRLERKQSILDVLRSDYKAMNRTVSKRDKNRLDQYFTSVRDVEKNLAHQKAWAKKSKPQQRQKTPKDDNDLLIFFRMMNDIIRLAIETDSTRFVTMFLDVSKYKGWHNNSHHGQSPQKIDNLKKLDYQLISVYGNLLNDLAGIQEGDGSLLDHTMVMLGSNLGDANIHNNINLPIFLAGGGFKHGQYLDYGEKKNTPLCNLFMTMLHKMGIRTDRFASSTGTIENFV